MTMETAQPRVSVILLAWRVTDKLLRAVKAVRAQVEAPSFEIVIVENGATAEVRRAVRAAKPDRILSSEMNLGFGKGCNLGVNSTAAQYAILLNDDAEPHPDWLRSLVDTADRDPTIGAVASLLLNPDGTVQEAGSRILPSGRTLRAGAGLEIDEARAVGLLELREVDYGSAAALLIRRTAFDDIGGFDPRYTPAYYEDVDLSFRLQLAGWRLAFQPAAVVTHDANSSTRALRPYLAFLDHRNLSLFQHRWHEVLRATPPADDGPFARAPIARYGALDRPTPPAPAIAPHYVVHEDVAGHYETWLGEAWEAERLRAESAENQLDDALQGAAALSANHENLIEEHRRLRAEYDELVKRHAALGHTSRLLGDRLSRFENGVFRRAGRRLLRRR